MTALVAPRRRLHPDDADLTALEPGEHLDPAQRRDRLAQAGYLWLRGLIPAERCRVARDEIVGRLVPHGCLDPRRSPSDLPWVEGRPVAPMFQETRDRQPAVTAAVQCAEVRSAIEVLMQGPAEPSTYLWTRPVPPGAATGVHIDQVYMGLGSPRILTTWCCLDAVPRPRGGLAVMPGSHRARELARLRETYGASDVDRDQVDGTFDESPVDFRQRYGDPWGGTWATAEFGVGDVMIFGMFLIHASVVNASDRYRLSCDARWTPTGEPMDPRWFGPAPLGHHRWHSNGKPTSMTEARQRWGV